MTDTTTTSINTAPTPITATQPASVQPPASANSSKPKNKPKRRNRTRRRVAGSDNEGSGDDGEAGNQSDSSASSRSDAGDRDSEDEDDGPAGPPATSKSLAFPDVSSITPAGWSKKGKAGKQEETISFEDFSAGKLGSSTTPTTTTTATGSEVKPPGSAGLSIKGKAKGKAELGPKREYTPEETAKYELLKAKRKEKQKAKKAELRDKKGNKEKEVSKPAEAEKPVPEASSSEKPTAPSASAAKTTPAQPTKGKGKKRIEAAPAIETPVSELTASTSALKLDDASAAPSPAPVQSATIIDAETSSRGVELLPESTSATPAPAPHTSAQARGQGRPLRGTQRDAYAQRVAEDPKFTPRVGQFWTHDQRLYEGGNVGGDGYSGLRQMSPFWRGRAVPRGAAFRGGFQRGRGGRGGFFPGANGRGGFVNGPPRPVELKLSQVQDQDQQEQQGKEDGSSSRLAMDREFELAEAREKARSAPKAPEPPAIETNDNENVETPAAKAVQPPTAPTAERKWGHEGFEILAGSDQFRGRGRGRGVRGGRGGVHPRGVAHLPFHPATIAAAAAAAKAASAASTSPAPTPPSVPVSAPAPQSEAKPTPTPGEDILTRPTADSLLDAADESVKIKLPGSAASVVPALSTPPITPASTSSQAVAPVPSTSAPVESAPTALEVSHEAQYPTLHSSSPGPVAALQAQMYTGGSSNSPHHPIGSDNGSAGSASFVPQHPNHLYAPGMNSSGEFVPAHMQPQSQHQQGRPFYPQQQRSYHAQSPQFYQPQSPYSPGPSYAGPPMASPQGMYYPGPSNGFANGHGHVHGQGRNSPLNPYMVNNHPAGGYFPPPRSTAKIAIRAPKAGDSNGNGESGSVAGAPAGSSDAQSNEANGDAGASAGEYYAQHYNPYVQPFVPSHRQEAVYYAPPTMNGQQYGQWQGYPDQGYYDSNGSYGY